jgi:hypothetical protein
MFIALCCCSILKHLFLFYISRDDCGMFEVKTITNIVTKMIVFILNKRLFLQSD